LTQRTRYPWDGDVSIKVSGAGEWELNLRIPGWCASAVTVSVNGEPLPRTAAAGSYVGIKRNWQDGDVVRMMLPMPVRAVEAHPHVVENAGQVALMRGPLLYCVEAVDNPGIDVRDVTLPEGAEFSMDWKPELLGGVVTLQTTALLDTPDAGWDGLLYRAYSSSGAVSSELAELTAIPYYAWANREAGRMQVWIRSR